jgi:valyl-tRNA synthetase
MTELDKAYDHSKVEEKIYKMWEESGFFNPDNLTGTEIFSMMLPPPNVTGTLHLGHAFEDAIQDITVRYQRMLGKKTLWLPGTDHAPIATESKVAKMIEKDEKKRKQDLGREVFVNRVNKFAQESRDTIVNQVRTMGASVDWSREAYTFDEQRNLAVRTAFKRMYDQGLIYRGSRIVNWDPYLKTTVSDDEVEYVEQKDPFFHFKYGPFDIGTVRPETKFGDKYVVMHPDDKRYAQYKHGDTFELEWINGPITATIIKDTAADMKFGSGCMTITPAHSAIDFEIAQRHHLDIEPVIDERGVLLPIAGEFAGQHIKKARAAIVEKLKAKGLITKIDENYVHNVATNSRGGGIIEPQIKEQWFVDVNKKFKIKNSNLKTIKSGQEVSLKELMKSVVASGEIKIEPERFEKIYFHWIDNLRDWCISRQLWFGHQIPVWYKGKEVYCDISPPKGDGWQQDPDTLDTWFSSGLWTFSTLGWPNETADLQTYHPTSLIMPGYEILFFWVARMILMSTYLLGQIPFRQVVLHGIVRDSKGRKFSKSLDNGIDPLQMTAKYGTDALRMALVFGSGPGNDTVFDEQRVKGMKHFANKLWNIARFVLANEDVARPFMGNQGQTADKSARYTTPTPITDADKEILAKLDQTVKTVTNHLDNFRLHEAAQEIYQFIWYKFADIYIEASKKQLTDENLKENTQKLLLHNLINVLKLLHPFMPFITEELWGVLGQANLLGNHDLLMVSDWPKLKINLDR